MPFFLIKVWMAHIFQRAPKLTPAQVSGMTLGSRMAVKLAALCGCWPFIFSQAILMVLWMAWNVLPQFPRFDPYPFVLLNLVLSCESAFTGPILLMASNVSYEIDHAALMRDLAISESDDTKMDRILALLEKKSEEKPDDQPA